MKLIARKIMSALVTGALMASMVPAVALASSAEGSEDDILNGSSEGQLPVPPEGAADDDEEGSSGDLVDEGADELPIGGDEVFSDALDPSEEAVVQDDEPAALQEARAPEDNITAFVTRLYTLVLGRQPDAAGLQDHAGALRKGVSAADVVWGFFGSPEFAKRSLTNGQRVDAAYRALLDRGPDAGGMATHVAILDSGMSMKAVVSSFVNSTEYCALCAKWGVVPGVLVVEENRDKNKNMTDFVQRLYEKVLDRKADVGGLNAHTGYLLSGGDAANLVWSFFGSPEFSGKRLSAGDRVDIAYQAMLDRVADPAGKKDWASKLDTGMSMRAVVAGFCGSAEFRSLCARWGIVPGALAVIEARDKNQNITAFVQRLYQKVLGRSADTGGLNDHAGYLLSGGSAASLAWTFFSSPEYANRNLNNSDKVESVYQAMLDRASDPSGKANWVNKLDQGESLYVIVVGFGGSAEFRKLCESYGIRAGSFTGDSELDSILNSIIGRYGTDLRALYNYVASYPYINGSKYPTGNWTPGFAKEMYRNGGGNCYRYAALFEQLARAAGYDAKAIAGHALNRQGGWNAHGWVEVYINGTTYVCDPQSTHAIPGRNFYMVTYGNAPLTYRTW